MTLETGGKVISWFSIVGGILGVLGIFWYFFTTKNGLIFSQDA